MKNRINGIITFFFLLCTLVGVSQSNKQKKADAYFELYFYQDAIELYERIEEKTPEVFRKLAHCYTQTHNNEKALASLDSLVNSDYYIPLDLFNYSQQLKIKGDYKNSQLWVLKYYDLNKNDSRAKLQVENQNYFVKLLKDDKRYIVRNLEINSEEQDFGVAFYQNKVVFSSSRKSPKVINRKWNWNGLPFLGMYMADISDTGSFTDVTSFHNKSKIKYHQGPASFSKDVKTIVYTRNTNKDIGEDQVTRFKMFYASLENDDWKEEYGFSFNSNNYSVGHPSLTNNGDTLFFSSDMPGGKGGADLYFVTRDTNRKWGSPINLGNAINTEGNEVFPFYHESGKLYFSSDGHPGLGGLDLFKSVKTKAGFTNIENLGVPFNSNDEDFSFVADSALNSGYFSSNRTGGAGNDDIYYFSLNKEEYKPCLSHPCISLDISSGSELSDIQMIYSWDMGDSTFLHGQVISHCYKKPGIYIAKLTVEDKITGVIDSLVEEIEIVIDSIEGSYVEIVSENQIQHNSSLELDGSNSFSTKGEIISYEWNFGDKTPISRGAKVEHKYKSSGTYDLSLKILVDNAEGDICVNNAYKSVYVFPPPIYPSNVGESADMSQIMLFSIDLSGSDSLDFYELLLEAKNKKNTEIVANAEVTVVDENNRTWYRQYCNESGKVSFLLDRNIKYTIKAKDSKVGVGKIEHNTNSRNEKSYSKAIIFLSNDEYSFIGTVLDKNTDETVEDVRLSFLDLDKDTAVFSINSLTGNFEEYIAGAKKGDSLNYKITISKEGYFTTFGEIHLKLDEPKKLNVFELAPFNFMKVKLGIDVAAIADIKPIYFDVGKFNISNSASKELDKVVDFLILNPNIVVELGSHTDSRGRAEFNRILSDKRAKSSANYIVEKGITKERIYGVGYGETKLVNKCKDGIKCSKDEHAENRRTEFRIVKIL